MQLVCRAQRREGQGVRGQGLQAAEGKRFRAEKLEIFGRLQRIYHRERAQKGPYPLSCVRARCCGASEARSRA